MLIFISLATFFATLAGGSFALRLKDRLHLVLGFSAGAVIGVAFFDLMPESLALGSATFPPESIPPLMALGFVVYLVLDRFVLLHEHEEENGKMHRGVLGAGSLAFHSFLDGIGIGLAFQVSPAVGIILALAVLTHDFSDGINTVNMILKNEGGRDRAFRWLFIDAITPVLGIISTLFFTLPRSSLALMLALFAGFFLYIGASDLLPESHHAHPVKWTTFMTVLGIGVMYLVIRFAASL